MNQIQQQPDAYDTIVKAVYWVTVVTVAAWIGLLIISRINRNKR